MAHLSYVFIIELLGTMAFAVSGAFSAMEKKLDVFGVVVIAFVTAIGGGTIRDVLIGNLPVTWMRDIIAPSVILATAVVAILYRNIFHNLPKTLFLFDSLGLGLFTITGIQKGLDAGIHPAICVALGTITGCFGGVIRDLLLREIPVLFHKEFYASACIVGGVVYFLLLYVVSAPVAQTVAIVVVCALRLLAARFNWRLPAV
ncbi:trimeric intracellular cation channel family protein [Mucilaginibacter sp. ZT4R22]|uniref:Trimeric intracellular cation channel family protein n=1 Tax=Mucilaginibacter pankratovii TaxID=2772110 RepID=A0ABR7WMW7_9SPHI|nr:trimeric intracellular cation channel family protein [Mucilaginibacter pankratovii]MBD1363650.1 trimeric intracellular cation channel family protein [Mucilaginibacter pankratovii]